MLLWGSVSEATCFVTLRGILSVAPLYLSLHVEMIAGWWARPEISQQDIIAHYLSPQSQLMASVRDRGTQNAFLWVINQFLRRSDLLDVKIIQVWRRNICGQLINQQQSHSSDFCSVFGRIIRTNTAAREPENITTALQMTNSGTGINISCTKQQARMFSLQIHQVRLDLIGPTKDTFVFKCWVV